MLSSVPSSVLYQKLFDDLRSTSTSQNGIDIVSVVSLHERRMHSACWTWSRRPWPHGLESASLDSAHYSPTVWNKSADPLLTPPGRPFTGTPCSYRSLWRRAALTRHSTAARPSFVQPTKDCAVNLGRSCENVTDRNREAWRFAATSPNEQAAMHAAAEQEHHYRRWRVGTSSNTTTWPPNYHMVAETGASL